MLLNTDRSLIVPENFAGKSKTESLSNDLEQRCLQIKLSFSWKTSL